MPRVLVIEDDALQLEYFTLLLSRAGYVVRGLRNGGDLAASLASESVDAIVTDVYMPDCDGIEVLLQMKRLSPALPVIGVTGGGFDPISDDLCNRAMARLGAVAVLAKPVDATVLLKTLERAMGGPAAESEGSKES